MKLLSKLKSLLKSGSKTYIDSNYIRIRYRASSISILIGLVFYGLILLAAEENVAVVYLVFVMFVYHALTWSITVVDVGLLKVHRKRYLGPFLLLEEKGELLNSNLELDCAMDDDGNTSYTASVRLHDRTKEVILNTSDRGFFSSSIAQFKTLNPAVLIVNPDCLHEGIQASK